MKAARQICRAAVAPCALLVLAALAGCTAVANSGSDTSTVGTVGGVGKLPSGAAPATETAAPDSIGDTTDGSAEGTTDGTSDGTDPSPTLSDTTIAASQTIGARAVGNRLLMIGDSLTASISQRYGGQACEALVPLGWRVEVDAETRRFIDFGKRVLDERLSAGWDAAVIFLGNNYGEDQATYQSALHALLLRLVPRPTVVITTALFRPQQADVNAAIAAEAAQFTSVTVLDWASLGTDPSITGADNLHLTDTGRRILAYYLAATVGTAPQQPGECLKTKYTDDSAGSPNGPAGNTTKPKTSTGTKTTTKTTVKPTATTVKSGGTVTTAASTSSTAGTSTASTSTASTSTASTSTASTSTASTSTASSTATTAPIPPTTAKPTATTAPAPTGS